MPQVGDKVKGTAKRIQQLESRVILLEAERVLVESPDSEVL